MHISSTVPWHEWLLFLVFIFVARKISPAANRSHHGRGDCFSNSVDGHGGDCGSDGGTHEQKSSDGSSKAKPITYTPDPPIVMARVDGAIHALPLVRP